MAFIIDNMREVNNFLNKYEDPRTSNWPLMSSPFYTLGICLTYVYLVKVLGPNLMKNRKPFQLKWILVIYNLFQVVFNAWMWYEGGTASWLSGEYNFFCQPIDYSDNPNTIKVLRICWWYYFSKFTDFLDTIFFVMRKKNEQISTLHVIHHAIMPMSVWFGVKFVPGGHSTFFGFLNTFVHVIMYSYYLLSAFGPRIQKYLWWKKYVTTIQMIQFIAILIHSFQLLFIECDYPRGFVWFIEFHAILFLVLFYQFYNEAYVKRNPHSTFNHSPKNPTVTNIISSEKNSYDECKNGKTNTFDVKYKGKYIN